MKLYFQKTQTPVKVTPNINGSPAQYLASIIEKTAKQAASQNKHSTQQIFASLMQSSDYTKRLLKAYPLARKFNFKPEALAKRLAQHFPIKKCDLKNKNADCPICLSPIKQGVLFDSDQNWYCIDDAYELIVNRNTKISPMNRQPLNHVVHAQVFDPELKSLYHSRSASRKLSAIKNEMMRPAANNNQSLQYRSSEESLLSEIRSVAKNLIGGFICNYIACHVFNQRESLGFSMFVFLLYEWAYSRNYRQLFNPLDDLFGHMLGMEEERLEELRQMARF